MNYWLLKTEPETFSWSDAVQEKRSMWDGVRSYAARRHLSQMKKGDQAFLYHSGKERSIIGVVDVVSDPYQDPTAMDAKGWLAIDVAAAHMLPRPISLADIKANPEFKDFFLVRQGRLSVFPVSSKQWKDLLAMASSH